jgi:hypothetical protein
MSLVVQVDLLLINGPGTCVPVALCHFFTRGWRQIIYVESICRYTDTVRYQSKKIYLGFFKSYLRSEKIYLGEDKPKISASLRLKSYLLSKKIYLGEDKPKISAFFKSYL